MCKAFDTFYVICKELFFAKSTQSSHDDERGSSFFQQTFCSEMKQWQTQNNHNYLYNTIIQYNNLFNHVNV